MPLRVSACRTAEPPTKVVTFGVLAIHAAESVRKGDRVTIQGHDLTSEAWLGTGDGQPKINKVVSRADSAFGASGRFHCPPIRHDM